MHVGDTLTYSTGGNNLRPDTLECWKCIGTAIRSAQEYFMYEVHWFDEMKPAMDTVYLRKNSVGDVFYFDVDSEFQSIDFHHSAGNDISVYPYKILNPNMTSSIPAGTFDSCISTIWKTGDVDVFAIRIFAPDVGLIQYQSMMLDKQLIYAKINGVEYPK